MSDTHSNLGTGVFIGAVLVTVVLFGLLASGILTMHVADSEDDIPEEYTIVTVYIDDTGTHYILEDQDGIQWMLTQNGTTVTLTEMETET